MERILVILEVSRKQDYIFSAQELRENIIRSGRIREVTESEFFAEAAGDLYREDENMVYSGGGHTILQFASQAQATAFVRRVTEAVLRKYRDMELFAKQLPYNDALPPKQNLKNLVDALERKKSLRQTSFRQLCLGIEKGNRNAALSQFSEPISPPEGHCYPTQFGELCGSDNFLAVVCIDGNAMGNRVQAVYEKGAGRQWDSCCKLLRTFSDGIQADFEAAFLYTATYVAHFYPQKEILPIRPIIIAGDDVCFVTAGSIGLECARIFLEKLSSMTNTVDELPYAACAGVVLVHKKFPFFRAHELAESLLRNAKRRGAELDEEKRISALDFHIEFGEMKDTLEEIRQDYKTDDGYRMELRPLTVTVPEGVTAPALRSYQFFQRLCSDFGRHRSEFPRCKLKELRTAFRQGETESDFFLADNGIGDILYHAFSAEFQNSAALREEWHRMLTGGDPFEKRSFRQTDDGKRCIFFDAIEMMDHFTLLEEAMQ